MKRTFIAVALTLLLAVPAVVGASPSPQFGPGISSDGMGRMDSPEQKSAAACSRGLRMKKKAEEEKDPQKKEKLYLKAKEDLLKAAGYQPNFDAYLALGQIYLALGKPESAQSACVQAQTLKPKNEAAESCLQEARKPQEKPADVQPAGGGGGR
jgi:cytochrome c-type biogenesis protein CcmH/NrfG